MTPLAEQHPPRRTAPTPLLTWAALAIIAILLRLPDIGNPLLDLDEQFYLLVGDRMLHGAIPYVDIWDRKPIGLFLIYAAARVPGGDPFVGYQVAATLTLIATAGLVATLARRVVGAWAGAWAGIGAGLVLLLWSEFLGGRGGQSPLFYDALMAGAALIIWLVISGRMAVWRGGLVAMLLCGLSLQIKPTTLFEGGWLGIALLVTAWRAGWRGAGIAGFALALIGTALLPTLAAFAAYATIGHAEAWWFANIVSIFHRGFAPGEPVAARLTGIALMLLVPAIAALFGATRIRGDARWFLIGWLAAALVGFALVPPYYNHYALPLVVPVAVLAGAGIAASRAFASIVALAGAGLLWLSGYPHPGERSDARTLLTRLSNSADRYRGNGCLYAFDAPPALYVASGSCLPTRYPFPPHLSLWSEAHAIGVDQRAERARILAARPPVIITGPALGGSDPGAAAQVNVTVARAYRPVDRQGDYVVWALRQRPADNP
jgi:diadenosine tetraphosphatase ApaH/serine/threonine PP2A family protein phosphatase